MHLLRYLGILTPEEAGGRVSLHISILGASYLTYLLYSYLVYSKYTPPWGHLLNIQEGNTFLAAT